LRHERSFLISALAEAWNGAADASPDAARKLNVKRDESVVENTRRKWRAGVLGATGLVGQRLVKLLADQSLV